MKGPQLVSHVSKWTHVKRCVPKGESIPHAFAICTSMGHGSLWINSAFAPFDPARRDSIARRSSGINKRSAGEFYGTYAMYAWTGPFFNASALMPGSYFFRRFWEAFKRFLYFLLFLGSREMLYDTIRIYSWHQLFRSYSRSRFIDRSEREKVENFVRVESWCELLAVDWASLAALYEHLKEETAVKVVLKKFWMDSESPYVVSHKRIFRFLDLSHVPRREEQKQ